MRRWLAVFLLCPGLGAAECRQALTLGLDVSGSVDPREYRLQLDGLAAALGSEEVAEALFGPGPPVRLSVYEWSGPATQRVVLPWIEIADAPALARAQATLRATERVEGELSTAIGSALLAGVALLEAQADCWTRTIDLSGDGRANAGPLPQSVRDGMLPKDITVNGLVIGTIPQGGDDRAEDVRALAAYYAANVTSGPESFVEMALGFEDYEEAMRRKLLRELASLAIGALPGGASRYSGSGRPDTAPAVSASE